MIFDTTLRDGEQSPGAAWLSPKSSAWRGRSRSLGSMSSKRASRPPSRGDWESVNAVAREVQGPIICGLARCNRDDIERSAKALKPAANHRIHVFLATSAIHRQYKLNMAQEEIIRTAVEGVKIARDLARTWSSRRKTHRAPNSISSRRSSRRRSTPARRP
jgi:2-isopropylmalate synthase